MTKPPEDPPERKSVTMPRSMWQDIANFQSNERIATEAETLRRVVMAGLRTLLIDLGHKTDAVAKAERILRRPKPVEPRMEAKPKRRKTARKPK